MSSVLLSAPESKSASITCVAKKRLAQDLSAVEETIASLQNHLERPETVMDLVHPECLRFELQDAVERKSALLAEYEQHLTVHGC